MPHVIKFAMLYWAAVRCGGAPLNDRALPIAAAQDAVDEEPPSAAWSARCDAMARDGVFGELPEIQAAAYLFTARIRVFMPDNSHGYTVRFEANRAARDRTLDLVLDGQHFRYVQGGVGHDSFRRGSHADQMIQNPAADGNCLFHCIAQGIESAPNSHTAVRAAIASALRSLEKAHVEGSEGRSRLALFAEGY